MCLKSQTFNDVICLCYEALFLASGAKETMDQQVLKSTSLVTWGANTLLLEDQNYEVIKHLCTTRISYPTSKYTFEQHIYTEKFHSQDVGPKQLVIALTTAFKISSNSAPSFYSPGVPFTSNVAKRARKSPVTATARRSTDGGVLTGSISAIALMEDF